MAPATMQPLLYAEADEANAPPPPFTPSPEATRPSSPARSLTDPPPPYSALPYIPARIVRRARQSSTCSRCTWTCFLIVLLVLHAIYAGFLYGYVTVESYPLPRGIINHTFSGTIAFLVFTYFVGVFVAFVDTCLVAGGVAVLLSRYTSMNKCCSGLIYVFLVVGIFIFIVALGGIIIGIVSQHSFAHACDGDWIQVDIAGHDWYHQDSPNTAVFSLVETGETLFTFASFDPDDDQFNLVGLNSTSPSVLPSLSSISFNDATNHLNGTCYGSNSTCLTGYVWPYGGLEFGLNFNGSTTYSRNQYNDWSFANVPSVILHDVESNGKLGARILQTSVKNPRYCQQQRICISNAAKGTGNVLLPQVLVPTAWILEKKAIEAIRCTRPRYNDG